MSTAAQLTGAASVPATFQVTASVVRPIHDTSVIAEFGAVTWKGPVPVVSSSVVSALLTPPLPSRAVKRKWSDSGLALTPVKPA